MTLAEPLQVTLELVETLDVLGIRYFVGGSVASSLHGLPRSTMDVDIVATVDAVHVRPLVDAVSARFYIAEEAVREAVQLRDSFNLIHLESMIKIDVFVQKNDPLWVEELARATKVELDDGSSIVVATPEDIVLQKLEWYRLGGGVSQQQWSDVVGVLKIQGASIDHTYLTKWAARKGLQDLLQQAFGDAE